MGLFTSYCSCYVTFAVAKALSTDGRKVYVVLGMRLGSSRRILQRDVRGPLNMSSIDVNRTGIRGTSYLALTHFRRSPHQGKEAVLVINASCADLVSLDKSSGHR